MENRDILSALDNIKFDFLSHVPYITDRRRIFLRKIIVFCCSVRQSLYFAEWNMFGAFVKPKKVRKGWRDIFHVLFHTRHDRHIISTTSLMLWFGEHCQTIEQFWDQVSEEKESVKFEVIFESESWVVSRSPRKVSHIDHEMFRELSCSLAFGWPEPVWSDATFLMMLWSTSII